ncbi:MAG: sucrose-phosphate phosphatase [Elainellaceae cyanobacterium]
MAKFLLITDLDNTLVGDDQALAELNQVLKQHREEHGTILVYSTGRSPVLYQELRQEEELLDPDFTVLAVGTLIYSQNSDEPDPEWVKFLSPGWSREEVVAIAAHFSDLVPQPPSEQTAFKASYFLDGAVAPNLLPQLESALQKNGLDIQLVYSSDQDLDILPKRGNKGAAVQFLQKRLEMSPDRTVVCGDSGNDIAMFQPGINRGVVVGNAKPELREWHESSNSADFYLAQAHCAGGILEGLRHFGFLQS